jgi:hypothetical protein
MSDLILDAMRTAVRAELTAFLSDLAPPAGKPALLTTAELAHELRVCGKTVSRLREEGLPTVYLGDACPRFVLADALTWLKSRPSVTGTEAQNTSTH